MKLKKEAMAGTLESNDILITVDDGEGISIELESSVKKQFGKQIEKVIRETLEKLDIKDAKVTAVDKGALDYTIRARVEAACFRAAESTEYKWS
ncbi:citrate lyase acyl carrier protein [Peptoniphilus sp. AGMB00490]|uniref:Citrate lyase acyl carrier protein n=2 Tax=Peptoniphilus TaxID=162289 RepID=A0ACD6AZU4_9FIRM|nr:MULTISPECIES: citrate lyase acyl carrier protein [Peptoniphilus]NMW85293.1 citrate lyase acyl carrier protein [Peptoniphilus faecalis]OLR65287.1 citrate lyase acyl carrier protein [Peptoniphilus porci]